MFIGHVAVALAAKRAAPRASLGWLVAACQLPDLVWPVLVLAGVERVRVVPGTTAFTPLAFDHYPWSHSLVTVALWGAALGAVHAARHGGRRAAAVLAGLAVSHWVLDWVTHRPDLPLAPGMPFRTGLGLWNSVPATLLVEFALFAAGVALYVRGTTARDRTGRLAFWSFVGFLAITHLANAFGPPPPSATAVAVGALAVWLLVAWAAWADRHRRTVAPGAA
jgi:hypothetical protein